MKKVLISLSILLLSSAVNAGWKTGNTLKAQCDSTSVSEAMFCMGYIVGAVEVMESLKYVCTPAGVTQGQLRDIFVKFVNSNPEKAHKDADLLILDSMTASFPCPKKK